MRAPMEVLKLTTVTEAFQALVRKSGLSISYQGPHCMRHAYALLIPRPGVLRLGSQRTRGGHRVCDRDRTAQVSERHSLPPCTGSAEKGFGPRSPSRSVFCPVAHAVKLAVRSFRRPRLRVPRDRHPGLGIGATTATFSITTAVLLKPLAYR